jgi:hypothetical protein
MNFLDFVESALDPEGYQHRKIIQHENRIESMSNSAHTRSNDLSKRVDELERANARTELVCVALLRTLIDRQLITKEGFIELARQIDAEDGKIDGRYNGEIIPKPEPQPNAEIKIDFNSARQKPGSLNT